MQTLGKPWLCSSPAPPFPASAWKRARVSVWGSAVQKSSWTWTYLKNISELCNEWDAGTRHQNHIPLQRFSSRGWREFTDWSPKGIMQVKSCCWRKQHRGVAPPLLSNNYSLLMDCCGQLKSAVCPGFWINCVGSKSFSFWQHPQYILYLDANLSNPRSDKSVWTSVKENAEVYVNVEP